MPEFFFVSFRTIVGRLLLDMDGSQFWMLYCTLIPENDEIVCLLYVWLGVGKQYYFI